MAAAVEAPRTVLSAAASHSNPRNCGALSPPDCSHPQPSWDQLRRRTWVPRPARQTPSPSVGWVLLETGSARPRQPQSNLILTNLVLTNLILTNLVLTSLVQPNLLRWKLAPQLPQRPGLS